MQITRIRALRGPNLWTRSTAIEAIVQCAPEEHDISQLPGLEDRLRARFPQIGALQPQGAGQSVSLADVLEAAALSLQAQAGCPVTFSRTHATVEEGTFQVVVEYTEESVGRLAMERAEQLLQAALADTPFDADTVVAELRELDEDDRIGPSTGSIVDAAVARGIPFRRLTSGSLVQLGWGSKARRIQAAELDLTSAVAESIAQDKDLTKRLLHAAGVPVPMGRPVADVDDAWAVAEEVGLPVVVKPQDGNQGKGVTVNITTRAQLEAAFATAQSFSDEVMVERFLPGNDFRMLVVGHQLVAAARRDPPQVLGDGQHSVRELVDIVNQDPRRGSGHGTALTKIRLDDIAIARLASEGLTPESVPVQGQRVVLRNNANLSTGGTATDVTDDVHPEIAARAIEAAQTIGLHICGVDVVCETMLKPLEEQSGGIVGVGCRKLRIRLGGGAGANGIAANAVGRPFARGAAREGAQRLFAHVVVTRVGVGVHAIERAHIDDAPPATRTHSWVHRLHGPQRSLGSHVHGPVHIGGLQCLDGGIATPARAAAPGVVHQNVDLAKVCLRSFHGVQHLRLLGHVAGAGLHGHAVALVQLLGQRTAGGAVDVAQPQLRAFARKAPRHPGTNASGCASDQGGFVVQTHGGLPVTLFLIAACAFLAWLRATFYAQPGSTVAGWQRASASCCNSRLTTLLEALTGKLSKFST